MSEKVKLIVAVAKNGIIGKNNDLIWHLPADMKFFTQTTKGSVVIMGRKNWDSIPLKYRPLSERTNVVVTRNKEFNHADCVVFNNLTEAVNFYKNGDKPVFIIGGGQIYQEALQENLVEEMYITHINQEFEGDTWFPSINPSDWDSEIILKHPVDEKNMYSFEVIKYSRKIL